MPETLRGFLENLPEEVKTDPEQLQREIGGAIRFPENQRRTGTLVSAGPNDALPDYGEPYIGAGMIMAMPAGELDGILRETIGRTHALPLPPDRYKAVLRQYWAENTGGDIRPPLPGRERLAISAEASTMERTIQLFGRNRQIHTADIIMDGNTVFVGMTEGYRKYWQEINQTLIPNYAHVLFTLSDMQKLTTAMPTHPLLANLEEWITDASEGDGTFQAVIPMDILAAADAVLKTDLMGQRSEMESHIVRLIKRYSIPEILFLKRQKDIRSSIALLNRLNPSPGGQYAISEATAKRFLDMEFRLLEEHYDRPGYSAFLDMPNYFDTRAAVIRLGKLAGDGRLTGRLVRDEPSAYATFLRMEGLADAGDAGLEHLTPERVKERYLLRYLRQRYEAHPDAMVRLYHETYRNDPPAVTVLNDTVTDAVEVQYLTLSPSAKLSSFRVEAIRPPENNTFHIGQHHPRDSITMFDFRTNVRQPRLLDLQDWACTKFGITFQENS